jgi:hypothetical protein
MNFKEATELLGDRSLWELRNMRKALTVMGALNTDEENKELRAVNVLLRSKR